jgi:ABC-type oligopeptide transport system substrate-binding subunit/class 3 adenylate cyclase/tRNA A-37 threonylcarbamoyl transferase component Bud32
VTVEVALGSGLAGFRVERLLGRGAMGAVYLAEDVHLKRKVAVKVLARELAEDERFRRRFLLESQLAASLEHPHIVPIYGAGEFEDVLYLAMKYVEGYDLRELIEATDRVGDERALKLLAQVGGALDAAHGLGLVHRDVKPANILIGAGDEEHAYLCDFGLAKHASTVASLTGDRAFVGTITYIAPEQIESGAVDARADVYSLSCVLFECLTGSPPFSREGDLQVVFAHLKEPPPLVTAQRPDLPDAIDGVVEKALSKEPDERYSSCAELIDATSDALKVQAPVVTTGTRRTIPGVRTFLIADIRGYTSYTHAQGDEAAARLASEFATVVQSTVEERDGRLIELRGDEALVVFDSSRQALRAAVQLQERFASAGLPRGIGIGLDAGEAVPVGEGYRGGALNLAARLCSLAGAGEILASETVQVLAQAVDGLRYGERRVERVKGFARPVPFIEVLPVGARPSRWNLRRLRRLAQRHARTRMVQVAVVTATIAAAVAAGIVLLTGGGSTDRGATHAQIPANSVGLVKPSGELAGAIPVGGLVDVARGPGGFWASNWEDGTVGRLDTATRKLVKPLISLGIAPGGFAAGEGYVWVEDGNSPTLLRINPQYKTIDRFHLPADRSQIDTTAPQGLATGGGSVWVATANEVFRVDPATGRVRKSIPLPGGTEIDYTPGAVWVTSAGFGTIKEINPRIDRVVKTIKLHDWLGGVAVGGGFVWGVITPDDTLWKIDTNGNVLKTFDIGHGASGPVYFSGYVWVPITSEGRLARVDPSTDEVTYFAVAERPITAAAGDGVLFVAAGKGPPPLIPLPKDEVATFSLAEDYVDDIDPATAFPLPYRAQLEYATGAKLLNYPDAAFPEGAELRPEVAAAMPTVSRDGRTYTFSIRPGYRFSPPSNEPVTAETFRYTLERALSPKLGAAAPAINFLGDIVGAQAFHSGDAKHVAGILVTRNRLRIRLQAPAGDFLSRLSLPYFAAVPIGTPIVDGGLQRPIPSAGPYYLEQKFGGERAVLERNPNYHGPRPRRLARIVYDINNSTRRTLGRINAGEADYTADLQQQSVFARGGPLDARFGAGAATAQRLYLTPQLAVASIEFNTSRGPFAAPRLRRAVSYAIDRSELAGVDGNDPTDQYVPPGMPGYRRLSVYPLRPDLGRAKTLAGNRSRVAVLYTCKRADCTAKARILAGNLAKIGIRLKVAAFDDPFAEAAKPAAKWDLLTFGWQYDWPDPASVFNVLVADVGFRPSWSPPPALSDPRVDAQLRGVGRVLPPARYAAYPRVEADILRREAPFAAYENLVLPEFFSARIGCKVFQPVYGVVDIGALCIRKS